MAATVMGSGLSSSFAGNAHAQSFGGAEHLIVLYFPDGVAAWSQDGDASLWHPSGGEFDFTLPVQLEPLARHRDRTLFFTGLSSGPTDNGSHPGGAKKLLTSVDGGGGQSIDNHLAHTVGADRPWRHLYLGAQAASLGASGDKFITYAGPGQVVTPQDDPLFAYSQLFGAGASTGTDGPTREQLLQPL